MNRRGFVGLVVGLVLLASGCSGGGHAATGRLPAARQSAGSVPERTTGSVPERTTGSVPERTTGSVPEPTTGSVPEPTTASAPTPTTVVSGPLGRAGGAGQVIVVTAAPGDTVADFDAYERTADGWREVFGTWTARVGYNGFAPANEKREGDGRTPSGTYGFDFMFGVEPDPGVRLPYRSVTGTAIVWDDDSSSSRYNQWVDTSTQDAGSDPEPMYKVPAYNHGVVIAYNADRTPGLGSAIFLHVSTGGPTAGCVSLPADELVAVLRWLDPARSPVIVMGLRASFE